MSSGYTLLSIGGLVLMMVAVINANRLIVDTDAQPIASGQYSQAVALADAMFGEMKTKRFDEEARDTLVVQPSSFTVILGPEAGAERDSCALPDTTDYRSSRWYNDIDDYHGYSRIVRIPEEEDYHISVRVYYLNEDDFSTPSITRTYLKKVVVTVINQTNPDTISISSIRGY